MAREILPSGGDAVEEHETIVTTFGAGEQRVVTRELPTDLAVAEYDETIERVRAGALVNVAAISLRKQRGRGTLEVAYERVLAQEEIDDGTQELYSIEQVRGIESAPYFASLTNAQIVTVRAAWEAREEADAGWVQLQKRLYGHYAHGQEQYLETAYEFRQTWTTTSRSAVVRSATGINTVQTLPSLSATLRRLINAMPAGQWLKKPTSVVSAGRQGWTVTIQYQWAPAWSVIYGGSFTGD